jgi:hypothetical protein
LAADLPPLENAPIAPPISALVPTLDQLTRPVLANWVTASPIPPDSAPPNTRPTTPTASPPSLDSAIVASFPPTAPPTSPNAPCSAPLPSDPSASPQLWMFPSAASFATLINAAVPTMQATAPTPAVAAVHANPAMMPPAIARPSMIWFLWSLTNFAAFWYPSTILRPNGVLAALANTFLPACLATLTARLTTRLAWSIFLPTHFLPALTTVVTALVNGATAVVTALHAIDAYVENVL